MKSTVGILIITLLSMSIERSAAQNLVANGTFDANINGWDNPFITSEWVASEGGPISGSGAMRISTSNNNNGLFGMNSDPISVVAGNWYYTAAWFMTPAISVSERGLYFIDWYDSDEVQLLRDAVSSEYGVVDDVWLPLEGDFRAPENASFMIIRLRLQSGIPGQIEEAFGFWDDAFVLVDSIFFSSFD